MATGRPWIGFAEDPARRRQAFSALFHHQVHEIVIVVGTASVGNMVVPATGKISRKVMALGVEDPVLYTFGCNWKKLAEQDLKRLARYATQFNVEHQRRSLSVAYYGESNTILRGIMLKYLPTQNGRPRIAVRRSERGSPSINLFKANSTLVNDTNLIIQFCGKCNYGIFYSL